MRNSTKNVIVAVVALILAAAIGGATVYIRRKRS